MCLIAEESEQHVIAKPWVQLKTGTFEPLRIHNVSVWISFQPDANQSQTKKSQRATVCSKRRILEAMALPVTEEYATHVAICHIEVATGPAQWIAVVRLVMPVTHLCAEEFFAKRSQ